MRRFFPALPFFYFSLPVFPAKKHHSCICLSIHAIISFTIFCCCAVLSSVPGFTLYHLYRQPRQQQAVACCATNTGCPRIGVCFPSFGIYAGASRIRTKSSAWERIFSMPLLFMYSLSFSPSEKRDRNFDFSSRARACSTVCISNRPHKIRRRAKLPESNPTQPPHILRFYFML